MGNLPDRAYQTFQIVSPVSTHTREATCEEVECSQYARGWRMKIDLQTDLGQKQAYYIKHQSGRSYKIVSQADGLVELQFASGQPCFQEHRTLTGRPEIFRVKGAGSLTRVHKRAETWIEEFQENQDRIKTVREKG